MFGSQENLISWIPIQCCYLIGVLYLWQTGGKLVSVTSISKTRVAFDIWWSKVHTSYSRMSLNLQSERLLISHSDSEAMVIKLTYFQKFLTKLPWGVSQKSLKTSALMWSLRWCTVDIYKNTVSSLPTQSNNKSQQCCQVPIPSHLIVNTPGAHYLNQFY